jgi:hypothetical protein
VAELIHFDKFVSHPIAPCVIEPAVYRRKHGTVFHSRMLRLDKRSASKAETLLRLREPVTASPSVMEDARAPSAQ